MPACYQRAQAVRKKNMGPSSRGPITDGAVLGTEANQACATGEMICCPIEILVGRTYPGSSCRVKQPDGPAAATSGSSHANRSCWILSSPAFYGHLHPKTNKSYASISFSATRGDASTYKELAHDVFARYWELCQKQSQSGRVFFCIRGEKIIPPRKKLYSQQRPGEPRAAAPQADMSVRESSR